MTSTSKTEAQLLAELDEFSQVDSSETRNYHGTEPGLSICRKLDGWEGEYVHGAGAAQ